MTLQARVTKIERLGGRGPGGLNDRDLEDAEALLSRAAEVRAHELMSGEEHPDAALMLAAETSGKIEMARDLRRRYWRARGVDYDNCEREYREQVVEPYLLHFRDMTDALERGEDIREMAGPGLQTWSTFFPERMRHAKGYR